MTAAGALLFAGAAFVSSASASTEPVITLVTATPTDTSATITWTTDEIANSQIAYGTTLPYSATTTLDTAGVMSHSETLSGLSPSTTYHYEVLSTDASSSSNMSPDATFTTMVSSSSSSTTTPDVTTLQNEITTLESEVALLQQEVTTLMGEIGSGTTTTPTTGTPSIDQNGQTAGIGSSIDFGGRNFAHEEQVNVSLNGTTITTAHADSSGNFSTGSLSLPSTAGTYTYTFTGAKGDIATATVKVQ
jgi:hypothetical protein